jgi:uncharacterized protein (DUF1499 family)
LIKLPLLISGLLVGACVVLLAWIRLAPDDPSKWHVDPLEAPTSGRANAWWVATDGVGVENPDGRAPSYAMSAADLAQSVDAFMLAQPSTSILAGSPGLLWSTYVQRSRFLRFPDYITVRTFDLGDGASGIVVWSRSRYGYSDLGVNRERVEKLLAALQPFAR